MTEHEIKQVVFEKFFGDFAIREEYKNGSRYIDAVAFYKTIPYVAIEIKQSLEGFHIDDALETLKTIDCYWCLVTDGKKCLLRGRQTGDFESYPLCDAIAKIKNVKEVSKNHPRAILQQVEQIFREYKHDKFVNYLELVPIDGNRAKVVLGSKQVEKKLFEKIIKNKFNSRKGEIHRYTSLRTAFEMINKKTFRMNGIAGMNDKSEGYYWDEAVSGEQQEPKETVNDYFISSFSSVPDDLTLWRLYGDEGKGVCLSFQFKEKFNGITLGKTKYAPKDANCFKFFKAVLDNNFVFQDIDQWKCFFKPLEYEVEAEYRLILKKDKDGLNIKDEGYYITNDSLIINPYVTLDMCSNDFPLTLKKITLGPLYPELRVNIVQLECLLKGRGIYGVSVKESKVKTYR